MRAERIDLDRATPAGTAEAAIDATVASGARELVLRGGDLLERADLDSLVRRAKSAGAERVVLEFAGAVELARAQSLRAAGVGLVRTLGTAGLRAWSAAGVPVEVLAPLSRQALHADLPAAVAAEAGDACKIRIVASVPLSASDPGQILSYPEAARAIAALDTASRAVGIELKLAPDSGPPPCLFESRERAAHLFALTAGGARRPRWVHPPPCESCAVNDRCPGLPESYLARFPMPELRPIAEERTRRRLSLIASVEEQMAREFVQPNRYKDASGADVDEDLIRINFHCNQSCRFCFVSTHLPPETDQAVRLAIRAAGERGAKVTLSGGEPTLNANLVEYVRLAKSVSRLPVQLQTNAVRLDDAALTQALARAGLDEAFVSLHGSRAEISDTITGAPGTFARTVVGIDNLVRTPIRVQLNFVICETNLRDLTAFVRLCGSRWPTATINVSFVAMSTDVVPRDRALVPRYSDALPHLTEALDLAHERGLNVTGFESMCGIPLCLVPAGAERYFNLSEIPPGFDQGEFVKTAECAACSLSGQCYGLRRGYAEMHGSSELRAVPAGGVAWRSA